MEIFIHVGPPKTGTSFIQQWCSRHREWFLIKGVFYPAHHLDKNLISSGNLLSLFEKGNNGDLIFSSKKLEAVQKEAKKLNANKLLFSSEYFFEHIDLLLEKIPQARVVLYLRNELEVVESSHNQSVKRHFKTSPFEDIMHPISSSLRRILRSFQTYPSQRFLLRFYAKNMFVKGNIVTDFLDTIGLDTSNISVQSKPINSSYSHKALEFKRAVNFYKKRDFHTALDEYLQWISENTPKYSLLSETGYTHAKNGYLDQIKEFLNAFPQENGEKFINICERKIQATRVPQFIHSNDVKNIVKGWLSFHPRSYEELRELCKTAKKSNLENYQLNVIRTIESTLQNERHLSFINIICRAYNLGPFQRPAKNDFVSLEYPTNHQQRTLEPMLCDHPGVELISHHIPKSVCRSFEKALTNAYGRESIFGVYENTGANVLTSGRGISLPKDVYVLHGHFASHVNHKAMFPNAKRICWIRDPAERLWLLTKHILRNKQPTTHYKNLLKYTLDLTELSVEEAFYLILTKPEFEVIRNTYQRYFQHIAPENFDFIGSTHRYEDSLSELENLINLPLDNLEESKKPDSESLVIKHPETYLKAKSLLSDEFNLVQKFC
ncbi:hypothetical protein [Alteromonas sp. 009811495]|uniref:hypothetical protein n=1 Tax=Alteromonas sp. 009811495 TaxID=3002962 RepID=UPI00237E405C|nr:hypothetical protein [Alteromonas sp. 009811495]WDT85604.1 hypothetical protein OZ660_16990 [Alteromonas sp. 009811495]